MERNLIWAVRASKITPTRKNLEELMKREDLFDEALIDTKSKEYIRTVRSFNKASQMGCSVVTYIDDTYPKSLRTLSLPPAVLYVRGNISVLNNMVYAAIVGSRKCDAYGVQVAGNLAMEIAATGAGIVSGGAEGVDAAAHNGALRGNVPTVAVLGCGLDIDYPKPNKELFDRIEKSGGAVISEFAFGTPPWAKNFPHRNRIIAAMASVVVLARAKRRSGGLITVNQAMSMGKTVFAVPGNIDSGLSAGANELIRDGAMVMLSPMDVIDELILKEPDFFVKEKVKLPYETNIPEKIDKAGEKILPDINMTEYEKEIVNIINSGYNTQNLIEEHISFEPSRLAALLGMMEIKGIIRKKADKSYTIIGGKC